MMTTKRAKERPMIDMQAIRKIYRTQHVETHALTSFTVRIEAGELFDPATHFVPEGKH